MTKSEIVQKNISLTFDFIRQIVKNPDLLQVILNDTEIEFLEQDLPKVVEQKPVTETSKAILFKVERTFSEISQLRHSGVEE